MIADRYPVIIILILINVTVLARYLTEDSNLMMTIIMSLVSGYARDLKQGKAGSGPAYHGTNSYHASQEQGVSI
jgi:hypothetical protein